MAILLSKGGSATLSTLATDLSIHKKIAGKSLIAYLAIAIFCLIFSVIYEHFSHAVYSVYMEYLCLIPLIGGVLPFLILRLRPSLILPSSISRAIYGSGIAALTIGCCLKGIFDIYGTSSNFIVYYAFGGFLLIGIALVVRVRKG